MNLFSPPSHLPPCDGIDRKWDILTESDFVTAFSQESIYKETGCYSSCSYSQYTSRRTLRYTMDAATAFNKSVDSINYDHIIMFYLAPAAVVTEREVEYLVLRVIYFSYGI